MLILANHLFTARIRSMGKVMFSHFTGVCLFTRGYPSPRFFPRSLVPGPFQGSTPVVAGGYPSPDHGVPRSQPKGYHQTGVPPPPDQDRTEVPGQDRTEVPPPPPRRIGLGHPPPPKTEQQSEYLLRGGQYASCGHAGGLSCFLLVG